MQQTEMFEGLKNAQNKVEQRFSVGLERTNKMMDILERDAIFDSLVQHDRMFFEPDDGINVKVYDGPGRAARWLKIHPHALGQLCGRVKLPLVYVQHLAKYEEWGPHLVCKNFNELFRKTPFKKQGDEPTHFLIRSVGNTLRGFLSRRYALHLSTTPLLYRFNEYGREMGAKPLGSDWSDVRLQHQMALPHVYRPFSGQHILIGMSFFNSDYGAGTFSVSPSVMDIDRGFSMVFPSMSLDSTLNKELFKKIHLGPLLQTQDLNHMGSDRAHRTDEISALMRDSMKRRLSKEFCQAICKAIERANNLPITWSTARRQLSAALLKEELDFLETQLKARDSKLPNLHLDEDGLPIPTAWWAAQAVASLAASTPDPDRKIELQHEAGRFVGFQ